VELRFRQIIRHEGQEGREAKVNAIGRRRGQLPYSNALAADPQASIKNQPNPYPPAGKSRG